MTAALSNGMPRRVRAVRLPPTALLNARDTLSRSRVDPAEISNARPWSVWAFVTDFVEFSRICKLGRSLSSTTPEAISRREM